MGIPQEKFTGIEAEIAGVIGILLEALPYQDTTENTFRIAESIGRYADQVDRIGVAAGAAGLVGLQDACVLFNETLADLSSRAQCLSDTERELLEEWPTLVMGYLESPDDPQASETLVKHLQDPVWKSSLEESDADILRSLLTAPLTESAREVGDVSSIEPAGSLLTDNNCLNERLAETLAEPQPSAAVCQPTLAEVNLISTDEEVLPTNDSVEAKLQSALTDLAPDKEMTFEAARLDLAETEEQTWQDNKAYEEATLLLGDGVNDKLALVKSAPSAEITQQPLGETDSTAAQEEQTLIPESFDDNTHSLLAHSKPLQPEVDQGENPPDPACLGSAEQELVEILGSEIAQLSESASEILDTATSQDIEPCLRKEALLSYAEQIERLADAAEAVGFSGLQQVCVHINANLLNLSSQERSLTANERALIEDWPALALSYLGPAPGQPACEALAKHLQDLRWPSPLPTEDVQELINLLKSPCLQTEEGELETRQRYAQPEDVSLDLPEDVNSELLDSLLQELPSQTADFSAAVQRLLEGEGTLKDLELAQRIAHTLKGAANTVGVKGIAVLTHHIEDILLALSKHAAFPSRSLADTLMNAADCLETMSEALLGMSTPPSKARDILQAVLDWANRIDQQGISAGSDPSEPKSNRHDKANDVEATGPEPVEQPTEPLHEKTTALTSSTALTAVPMLRVPAQLIDNLLRLVGESMILTGQIQERIRKTMLHVHTMRAQNLTFQQLTADLEQLIDIQNVMSPLNRLMPEKDFDPLELDQYNELHSTSRRLVEAVTDSQELNKEVRENLTTLDTLLVDQGRLHRETQETVLRTRMIPVKTIIPRLQRSVRQTCRLTDKQAELYIKGADTLIDSNVLADMVDPLMHVLRNAVDHGIESPETRQTLGKDRLGKIDLHFVREGNNVVVRCRDDGAGLDTAAIRRTAERRGLIGPEEVLSEDELSRLILLPGFSTRSEATQVSGRGIGLDAVYSRLLENKGSLQIQSQKGKGCLMELRLPITLISTHALLVRTKKQIFAISDRGVEQILYSGSGEISKLGKSRTFQVGNDIFEVSDLESLLNLPKEQGVESPTSSPIILVREESGTAHAVSVQEILDSRDLVVKNMGRYIPKLRGVMGAAILGDGGIAPVLDLPELLRTPIQLPDPALVDKPSATSDSAITKRHCALVVDDSLSARRSLAQFMEDTGFEVLTARDGLEAISIINGKRPDILMVDLEMPRMNGLELTSHVRAREVTHNLPVIMITSRSTEKHRREAKTAGVDVYLTKPFAEDELLKHINTVLERA